MLCGDKNRGLHTLKLRVPNLLTRFICWYIRLCIFQISLYFPTDGSIVFPLEQLSVGPGTVEPILEKQWF